MKPKSDPKSLDRALTWINPPSVPYIAEPVPMGQGASGLTDCFERAPVAQLDAMRVGNRDRAVAFEN